MRSPDNKPNRHKSLFRSDIFQVCLGLVLAVFLFQADRAISAQGNGDPLAHPVVNKGAIAAGIRVVRLECDTVVALLGRVVKIDASACGFICIQSSPCLHLGDEGHS